jgi:hypothetical protein
MFKDSSFVSIATDFRRWWVNYHISRQPENAFTDGSSTIGMLNDHDITY